MTPIMSSALSGLGSAGALASSAATSLSRISSPQPGDPDIASDFVTLSSASNGVAVGAKLAQVAQQDDKTLLDIIA
jgi:hypothetical protein